MPDPVRLWTIKSRPSMMYGMASAWTGINAGQPRASHAGLQPLRQVVDADGVDGGVGGVERGLELALGLGLVLGFLREVEKRL